MSVPAFAIVVVRLPVSAPPPLGTCSQAYSPPLVLVLVLVHLQVPRHARKHPAVTPIFVAAQRILFQPPSLRRPDMADALLVCSLPTTDFDAVSGPNHGCIFGRRRTSTSRTHSLTCSSMSLTRELMSEQRVQAMRTSVTWFLRNVKK